MIGYKKCVYFDKKDDDNYIFIECIVELEIPDNARVVRPRWIGQRLNKLRCDRAIVKAIFSYDKFGNHDRLPDDTVAYSISSLSDFVDHFRNKNIIEMFKGVFTYIVGKTVTPEYDFDDSEYHKCGSGIHFFETFEEAVKYGWFWPFTANIKDTLKHLMNRKD